MLTGFTCVGGLESKVEAQSVTLLCDHDCDTPHVLAVSLGAPRTEDRYVAPTRTIFELFGDG